MTLGVAKDDLKAAFPDDIDEARTKFRGFYNTILNELPWTEFISTFTSAAKATDHIVAKLERNAENGVRHINIHGLGAANVKKIARILPDIEKQSGALRVRVDQDATRIFVRLEIPVKQLGSHQPAS